MASFLANSCFFVPVLMLRLFIVISIMSLGYSFAQTQTVRGIVLNSFNQLPVEDVQVKILLNDSIVNSTFTDSKGEFLFVNVPLGMYDVAFTHVNFESFILPDITLLSSRETYLDVNLVERLEQLEEFSISKPKKDRSKTNNEMVTNSVKTIYPQDMKKLAGSLDDPIRVAGMMPGVTSDAAFSENFISIRGNSPRGLKYMMEGVELFNPTHFARIGSSGGTFTVFSMQLLDKSDFYTGAFPAEYSNAMSGVLDVNFRSGNNTNRNYAINLGTLGLDFAAEGPFSKNKKSSYLVNYRYSVVGMARLIGYPTQPTYQDLSYVLDFPTKKGKIKLFGIAGTSDRKRLAIADSSLWEGDIDRYNLTLHSDMVTIGGVYDHHVSENTLLKFTVAGGGSQQVDDQNYLLDDYSEIIRSKNEYSSIPISTAFSIKHKFSIRHTNKTGFSANYSTHNWDVLKYDFENSHLDTVVIGTGASQTYKAYTQSRILLNEKWSVNLGVAGVYYDVNQKYSVEPRLGISYETKRSGKISLALGKHSQIENYATYLFQKIDSLGNNTHPNKSLDFVKAYHAVMGYRTTIFKNHYLNVETYYQYLYDVPVEAGSSYSVLNISELEDVRELVNDGVGENVGLDVSIERYANKGLYYMINASIYSSRYKGGDGIWRSTEFDQMFNIKFLAGKEYIVGEKKGKTNYIGWNTNLAYVGGRPYTPIDLIASEQNRETIYNEALAFTQRGDNLLFLDVTFTYKINKYKHTGIWSLQIKNLFSNGNAIYREYDAVLKKEVTIPSSSFFPNLSYKILF